MDMEHEREFVSYIDDDGNEGTLEVLDYFFYNGEEYAVITVVDEDEPEHEHGENCDCEQDVFFMKVTQLEDDEVELEPVDDELADKLLEVINNQYTEEDE